jgi:alpha-glucoside transport system substrate-binding protein
MNSQAELRQFIAQTFNDEELQTLCFDYFPVIFQDFTTGMTKSQRIIALISYAQRRGKLDHLQAVLAKLRLEAYANTFDRQPERPVVVARRTHDPRQVFICHAHEDAEFARQLADDLQAAGYRVWMAPDSIEPGEKWLDAIGRGLEESGVFVLLLTPNAVNSNWVKDETNVAISLSNENVARFFVLSVQSTGNVPLMWRQRQYVRFDEDYESGLAVLLKAISTTPTPKAASEPARKTASSPDPQPSAPPQTHTAPLPELKRTVPAVAEPVVPVPSPLVVEPEKPLKREPELQPSSYTLPSQAEPAGEAPPVNRLWLWLLGGIILVAATVLGVRQLLNNNADVSSEPGSVDAIPASYLEQAYGGAFTGTTVVVDGSFMGDDVVQFEQSVAPFEEATGINVRYVGSNQFETTFAESVLSGNAADIADFPQPGLLAGFVEQGMVVDVREFLPQDVLEQRYDPSWLTMATMPGPEGPIMAGVWHRFNTKSLVWYPKRAFEQAGYEIPQTWDELLDLTQRMAEDGRTAWCIGIESGAATGWPATDWTEDLLLRTAPLEAYDAWVTGDLPFQSREVRRAIELFSEIWFNDRYVYGGREFVLGANFADAFLPMLDGRPPGCWLHKQASFITVFFPEELEFGVDYDFFYFPPVDAAMGRPMLIAGDIMAMFNDRPEVRALMEYFTTPESVSGWLENGAALATQKRATPEMYGSPIERQIADLNERTTAYRFDASDMMPSEVGAGSFWRGMTDYLRGENLDAVLAEIDATWPRP